MKNLFFLMAILFSTELLADDEYPMYYGKVGKCHLWKTVAGNNISGTYFDYYMNLSPQRHTESGYLYYKDALVRDGDFKSLTEAAKIHPKCAFDKEIACDFDKGSTSVVKQTGCGEALSIVPVSCKSGDGPKFSVMVACTVKPGQKVNPTKCYNAKAGENGGDAPASEAEGGTR